MPPSQMSGRRLRFTMVAVGLTLGPVADGAAPAATCRDLNYFGLSGVAFDTMEACNAWAAGLNGVLLQCSGSAGGFQCQARAGEVLLVDPDNCDGALASVEGTLTDFAGQGSPMTLSRGSWSTSASRYQGPPSGRSRQSNC